MFTRLFQNAIRARTQRMKRLMTRFVVLAATVGLGIVAIAQARHGLNGTHDPDAGMLADSRMPAAAPGPIRASDAFAEDGSALASATS